MRVRGGADLASAQSFSFVDTLAGFEIPNPKKKKQEHLDALFTHSVTL